MEHAFNPGTREAGGSRSADRVPDPSKLRSETLLQKN